jgi:predicted DNA-binding transcriptional regulator YafY
MKTPQSPTAGAPIPADPVARTFTQHERFHGIHAHLKRQYPLGLKNPKLPFIREEELAEEFAVTPRTIRTDIFRMQTRLNLPIRRFTERNGGFGYTQEVTHFPLDEFTGGEQKTMVLALHAFDAWAGLPLHKKLPRIFTKLGTTAGAQAEVDSRHLKRCVTFKAGGYQAPMNEAVFERVLDAVLQRRELRFPYHSLEVRRADAAQLPKAVHAAHKLAGGAGRHRRDPSSLAAQLAALHAAEMRHVQPLHLLCWQYAWYLFAWDYDRQGIRTFALGRMTSVEDTGTLFKPAVQFNLRKELEHSFGITRAKAPENIHLRFVPEAIPLIVERLWHPTQKLVLNEDGTLDLTMAVAVCPELIRWVAGWREDVQVLSPTTLDEALITGSAEFLRRTAARLGVAVESLMQ